MRDKQSRRTFVKTTAAAVAAATVGMRSDAAETQPTADTPAALQSTELLRDVFSCSAGRSADGIYAAMLVIDDVDADFASHASGKDFDAIVENERRWSEAFSRSRRKLLLATFDKSDTKFEQPTYKTLSTAARIDGPVCPDQSTEHPVVVWIERQDDAVTSPFDKSVQDSIWSLYLSNSDDEPRRLQSTASTLRNPTVTIVNGQPIIAVERENEEGTNVIVYRVEASKAVQVLESPGRHPKIAAGGDGRFILMVEQATRDSITLELMDVETETGRIHRQTEIDGPDDYTFNGDLIYDPDRKQTVIAAECSPAFGINAMYGLIRDIRTWVWADDTQTAVAWPSEADNRLPTPRTAFHAFISDENCSPLRPQLMIVEGRPTVVYRQFRFRGMKTFGWDVWWSRADEDGWARPVRLTDCLIGPDTNFGMIEDGGRIAGVYPCVAQNGRSSPVHRHWLQIDQFGPEHRLADPVVPEKYAAEYWVTPHRLNIAPDPPELPESPEGLKLVWGDLHPHSTYSKCVAAIDGSPDEVVRFQRDVLGCDVISFVEHGPFMSGAEFTWSYDRLEAEAGPEHVVIYGNEPPLSSGRHTNWFTTDREVFDRLRQITQSHARNRADIYRHVLAEIGKGKVVALRHFHGNIQDVESTVASFEPRLEIAMEAMQGRINAMMEPGKNRPAFPGEFLDAGHRIGLIGGTDHYRTILPNHYCLTGFWVKNLTPEGVWEALLARRTIAVSDAKVALWATLAGQSIGNDVTIASGDDVRVKVTASAARKIRRATLIRDGEILPWKEIDAQSATFELVDPNPAIGPHWYVVTTENETAYDDTGIAHGSPFFVNVKSR